jgi:hypothetical protein
MEEDSITSFLESVLKDDIEKKIIQLISEDIDPEKMLEQLIPMIGRLKND